MTRPTLKPLQGQPLTFHHCCGEILWNSSGKPAPIARDMAESLRDIYCDETEAAYICGDLKTARHATKLWRQLTDALDLLDMHQRLFAASRRAA